MIDGNIRDCFQINYHNRHSVWSLPFCKSNGYEYINSFGALFIIFTGFYSLFFYRHNIPLLRLISSSLTFNGIASFFNHWYGTNDWLFIDKVSLIIPIYLLLTLSVYTFITNYQYLVTTPLDTPHASSPISVSMSNDIDYAQQMIFNNISPQYDTNTVPKVRLKLFGSIFCFLLMCFVIYSNINGCYWSIHFATNIFIIFTLIIPLIIFSSLILFYWRSKQNDHHIGSYCHSSYTADMTFKCYIRGIVAILIGNVFQIITEVSCFPGHILYNLFSFYGYALIILYITYLSNDIEQKPCFFQTLNERHLSVLFIWFHWMFPSLVYAVSETCTIVDLNEVPSMDAVDNMKVITPIARDNETDNIFLRLWNQSEGEIVLSDDKEINDAENYIQPITIRTTQLRVVEQSEGDQSCGYYALFFISKLSQIFNELKAFQSNTQTQTIIELMQELRSKKAFDDFKGLIMSELLIECKNQNGNNYPWNDSHVTGSGILERAYLQFLQNDHDNDRVDLTTGYPTKYNNSVANKYGFRYLFDVINLLEFSEVALKTNHLPLITIKELEYFFNEKLFRGVEDYKIFLIGSAIHYVTCAIYRNDNHIDILYLDSQNDDILYKNSSVLKKEVINRMKFKSWLNHGWQLNDMRRLAKDSFKGIQFVVTDLLMNAICNIYSKQYTVYFIRDQLIQMNVYSGFLGSFKIHSLQPIIDYISDETNNESSNIIKYTKENEAVNGISDEIGWFVFGVNSLNSLTLRDELKEEFIDDDLNVNIFENECKSVIAYIKQKLIDVEIDKQALIDIGMCSDLVKEWIVSYYPSAVIESNIINVLNKLEEDALYRIPKIVTESLIEWSALMRIFASTKIDNDSFWDRLSTTLLIVELVLETNRDQTKY